MLAVVQSSISPYVYFCGPRLPASPRPPNIPSMSNPTHDLWSAIFRLTHTFIAVFKEWFLVTVDASEEFLKFAVTNLDVTDSTMG